MASMRAAFPFSGIEAPQKKYHLKRDFLKLLMQILRMELM